MSTDFQHLVLSLILLFAFSIGFVHVICDYFVIEFSYLYSLYIAIAALVVTMITAKEGIKNED